ncbi:MAG: glycosyltransferase family 2 protein [bacterium]|nr:glycosyltransferase family 2 protein [bacterium]
MHTNPAYPKISIIIPAYGQPKELGKTLLSINNSDYKNYEVIVVDDASKEDISKIVKKFDYRLVKLDYNQGPSSARNTGASLASGEIFLFIDSDVLIKSNTLSYIADIFTSPDIDCLIGLYTKECPNNDLMSKFKNLFIRYSFLKLSSDVSCLHTSISAIKKDVFEQSGGFDKNITKPRVEDIIFGKKLKKMGFKINFDPNLEVTHNKKYDLLKLIANDFNKGSDYIKAFFDYKWFNIINKKQHPNSNTNFIISIPSLYLSVLFIILFFYTKNTFFLILNLIGTASFLASQSQFLYYLAVSEGVFFALKSVPLVILNNFIFGLAVINGIFLHFNHLGNK